MLGKTSAMPTCAQTQNGLVMEHYLCVGVVNDWDDLAVLVAARLAILQLQHAPAAPGSRVFRVACLVRSAHPGTFNSCKT